MYEIVEVQLTYVIVKRDNVYYTVVPDESEIGFSDLSSDNVRHRLSLVTPYVYDIDGTRTGHSRVYDKIRSKFRGYILIGS
jgi:hypothetical protein